MREGWTKKALGCCQQLHNHSQWMLHPFVELCTRFMGLDSGLSISFASQP